MKAFSAFLRVYQEENEALVIRNQKPITRELLIAKKLPQTERYEGATARACSICSSKEVKKENLSGAFGSPWFCRFIAAE